MFDRRLVGDSFVVQASALRESQLRYERLWSVHKENMEGADFPKAE